ncbi:MAG TPA: ABC transporter ATP-binding protein [Jatrophihabitans sp.]|jgi:oligopeptide/dipeptide ABC transporter ATP-binding protein|nr:ABC transporter ATP-binding protein [Jatrophihabitans sp.]
MTAVLSVQNLRSSVRTRAGDLEIVHGVSFDVAAGETLAVVGESGSGKSFTALSIAGLLPAGARVTSGEVVLDGQEMTTLPERLRRATRGARIGMVYQDPMSSLNPLMRIRSQVAEGLVAHGWEKDKAAARTLDVLGEVGLPSPAAIGRLYPHQLSGGMQQRVLIASAIAARPQVLIADEPTTALDVTIQQQIVDLVARLRDDYGLAVVWITHDLGVVARIADRVLVMYAGRVVEHAPTQRLFAHPEHPYTAGLLGSIPTPQDPHGSALPQIGGAPVSMSALPLGCPFHPRCPQAEQRCAIDEPPLTDRDGGQAACWVPPAQWRPA